MWINAIQRIKPLEQEGIFSVVEALVCSLPASGKPENSYIQSKLTVLLCSRALWLGLNLHSRFASVTGGFFLPCCPKGSRKSSTSDRETFANYNEVYLSNVAPFSCKHCAVSH
jgi:hypothetical protein